MKKTPAKKVPTSTKLSAKNLPVKKSNWEFDLGGKIFTGIGAIAIVIGFAYLLRYAFENNLITEPVRILLGVLVGALLLFIGQKTRSKTTLYSHIITASGLTLWYLTAYAATGLYNLVDWKISAVGMLITAALGTHLALKEDSLGLAALATTGAYLVPTFLDPIEGNAIVWFSYLTIINAMTFFLATRKQWKPLLHLAFAAQILLLGTWMMEYFAAEQWPILSIHNALFIAMMLGAYCVFDRTEKGEIKEKLDDILPIAGSSIFSSVIFVSIAVQSGAENWKALGALLIGLACMILSTRLKRFTSTFLYTGLFLLLGFGPLQLEDLAMSLTWSALMLAGVPFALRSKKDGLRYIVYVLFVANLIASFMLSNSTATGFWDERSIAQISFIIAALCMSVAFLPKVKEEEGAFLKAMFVGTSLMALSLMGHKWMEYAETSSVEQLGVSGMWALYALSILALGAVKKLSILRQTGIGILSLVILKVFLVDSQSFDTLYKFVAYFSLGVILLGVGFMYERYKQDIKSFVKGD